VSGSAAAGDVVTFAQGSDARQKFRIGLANFLGWWQEYFAAKMYHLSTLFALRLQRTILNAGNVVTGRSTED
jgi:hypothetical protein